MRLLHNKINLLVVITLLISAALISGVIIQTRIAHRIIAEEQAVSESNSLKLTFEVHARQHDKLLRNLAGLDGLTPRVLLANSDPEQFMQLFETYPISFIAVTDSSLMPIATFPAASKGILNALPNDPVAFGKFRSDGKITRYYAWIDSVLTRIAVIDIPWYNGANGSPASGVLFAGFPESTGDLAYMIQGNVRLIKEPLPFPISKTMDEGKVVTQLPLYSWRNTAVAALWLETPSKMLNSLNNYRTNFLWFIIISSLIFILFISVYLYRYYKWPLRMFTLSIRNKDPEYLRKVHTVDRDFLTLQHTVMNLFTHERLLNDMIRRRNADNQNAFHAAILAQINDAIYATNHQGIITYWNRGAEEIYSVYEHDALGKVAEELIKSRWIYSDEEAVQQHNLEVDGVMRGRLSQERPDGSEITVDAGISRLFDINGELLGQLYVIRKSELIPA